MKIVPRITKPCSQDWAGMKGDEKRRFCEECQLHVHNLPAMSEEERGELLSRRERRCVVYVADDRTIRVSSELWLVLHRIWRGWRRGLAFLLVGLALGTTGYGASEPTGEGAGEDGGLQAGAGDGGWEDGDGWGTHDVAAAVAANFVFLGVVRGGGTRNAEGGQPIVSGSDLRYGRLRRGGGRLGKAGLRSELRASHHGVSPRLHHPVGAGALSFAHE